MKMKCARRMKGRYVVVQQLDKQYLIICEAEVFGNYSSNAKQRQLSQSTMFLCSREMGLKFNKLGCYLLKDQDVASHLVITWPQESTHSRVPLDLEVKPQEQWMVTGMESTIMAVSVNQTKEKVNNCIQQTDKHHESLLRYKQLNRYSSMVRIWAITDSKTFLMSYLPFIARG